MRLYVGDRDDVGASKIGGFDNGDNVVVCLMRQFIDDSELMTKALGSIKPLPKYIFVLLDVHPIFIHSPTSTATALTRLCLHPGQVKH